VRKLSKPRPDFPLFPHATDRWAKKVRGKLHYFGKVSTDPRGEAALELWLDQKDALLAGRIPRKRNDDERTLEDVCDSFLATKECLKDSGEISPRTFADYFATCGRLLDHFGKDRIVIPEELTPDDFGKYRAELARTRGPVALGNELVRVRMVFKFADEEGLIPNAGQGSRWPKDVLGGGTADRFEVDGDGLAAAACGSAPRDQCRLRPERHLCGPQDRF